MSFSRLPNSLMNAKNLIYFHTVYAGDFFFYAYRSSYSIRFFLTDIVLYSRQFTVNTACQEIKNALDL